MTASSNLLRTLVTYSVVLPVALLLGYLVAQPLDFSSLATFGIILGIMAFPLILKWHHPILFLSWNMMAALNFLPGRPELWLAMAFMSLGISVLQRTLVRQMRFIHAPSVLVPLLVILLVVFATAHFTGGMGLKALGSSHVGGKSYLVFFGGAIGFLAMLACRIPPHKAGLFVGLFFLGGLPSSIGGLVVRFVPALLPLLYIFPNTETISSGAISRFSGLGIGSLALVWYLLARYGISGMLGGGRFVRLFLLGVLAFGVMLGGFRGQLVLMLLVGGILFYLEGLVRSRQTPLFLITAILVCVTIIPLADKLPLPIQRSLSVLPLNVDPLARNEADNSSEWRVEMWKMLLPEVPKYFWLGKGLEISLVDLDADEDLSARGKIASQESFITSGNFHNGPLSVIIFFGIWGVIAWIWFLLAGIRALHLNRRYGGEELKMFNNFLFALFVGKAIYFFAVFGDFRVDLPAFVGILGLSLALNGGIRKAVRDNTAHQPIPIKPRRRLEFSPAFSPSRPRSASTS